MYAANKFWHMIPPLLKNEVKENIFKKKLKCFLISKGLYLLNKLNS